MKSIGFSPPGVTQHQPRSVRGKTLFAMLLTTSGLVLAQSALADRDSFPAWQQRQFAGQKAHGQMAMPKAQTAMAGRDASFQNWRARQYLQHWNAREGEIATSGAKMKDGNSGTAESTVR